MVYQVRALVGLPGYRTPDPASMLGSSQLTVTPALHSSLLASENNCAYVPDMKTRAHFVHAQHF